MVTYTVSFLIEHKGSDSPTSIGAVAGLTADTNGGAAPTVLILGSGNGASGHWHDEVSGSSEGSGDNRSG